MKTLWDQEIGYSCVYIYIYVDICRYSFVLSIYVYIYIFEVYIVFVYNVEPPLGSIQLVQRTTITMACGFLFGGEPFHQPMKPLFGGTTRIFINQGLWISTRGDSESEVISTNFTIQSTVSFVGTHFYVCKSRVGITIVQCGAPKIAKLVCICNNYGVW